MAFQIDAVRENAQLAGVFEELHRHAHDSELDARRSSRSLGRARGSAETIGAAAKKETDRRQVLMRQLLSAHDIIYTVVSTAMSWSGGGSSGANSKVAQAKAKALEQSGALNGVAQRIGSGDPAGAANARIEPGFSLGEHLGGEQAKKIIEDVKKRGGSPMDAARELAAKAKENQLEAKGSMLSKILQLFGPVVRVLSPEAETLQADTIIDGVRVGDVLSEEELDAISRLHHLRQALEQAVAESKGLAGVALLQENADRSAAADEHERVAAQLADAEAAAKRRRAKAQVEQTEIEQALLELGSGRSLA